MSLTRPAQLLILGLFIATPLMASTMAPAQAHAQATPAAAQQFLEGRHQAVQSLLRRPASPQRNQALAAAIEGLLDYDDLAREALGSAWDEHSADERHAFADLLKQLVQKNYERNLQNTLDFRVTYEDAQADADAVVVRTEARSRTNRRAPPVSIDYRMHLANGAWRVIDISTDGASMVQSYRRQFRRIISREGWDGLLSRMRSRLEDGGGATAG